MCVFNPSTWTLRVQSWLDLHNKLQSSQDYLAAFSQKQNPNQT